MSEKSEKTLVRSAIIVSLEALFCLGLVAMIASYVVGKEDSVSEIYVKSLMFGGFATVILSLLIVSVMVCVKCTSSDGEDSESKEIIHPEVVVVSHDYASGIKQAHGHGLKRLLIPGIKLDPSLYYECAASSTGTPDTVSTNLDTKTRQSIRSSSTSLNTINSTSDGSPHGRDAFSHRSSYSKNSQKALVTAANANTISKEEVKRSYRELMRTPTKEEVEAEYIKYLNTQVHLESMQRSFRSMSALNSSSQKQLPGTSQKQKPGREAMSVEAEAESSSYPRNLTVGSSADIYNYSHTSMGAVMDRRASLGKRPLFPSNSSSISANGSIGSRSHGQKVLRPKFSNSIYEGRDKIDNVLGGGSAYTPGSSSKNYIRNQHSRLSVRNSGQQQSPAPGIPQKQNLNLISTGSTRSGTNVYVNQAEITQTLQQNKSAVSASHVATTAAPAPSPSQAEAGNDGHSFSFSFFKKSSSSKEEPGTTGASSANKNQPKGLERNHTILTQATYGDGTLARYLSGEGKIPRKSSYTSGAQRSVARYSEPGTSGHRRPVFNASIDRKKTYVDRRDSLKEHHERMVNLQFHVPQRIESMRSSKSSVMTSKTTKCGSRPHQ